MIAYLKGKITVKEPTHVIVECAGVGYLVKISLATYSAIQPLAEVLIHIHYWVKEDVRTLYGFHSPDEKAVFELLVSVNGVGGSTALMILSSLNAGELAGAIAHQDVNLLKRIKGIGQKTAERIVLELKDKFKGGAGPGSTLSIHRPGIREEALQALINLGFTRLQMEKRLDELMKEAPEAKLEELIKAALRG